MDQTLGMIMVWPFNWAPAGWALCNGTILPIQGNQALYSIIGTTYGGDGKVNFALPDLRGRVAMGVDATNATYSPGKTGGAETFTLDITQIPPHTHTATPTPANVTVSGALEVSHGSASTPGPTASSYIAAGSSPSPDGTGAPIDVFNFLPSATNMVTLPNALSVSVNSTNASISIGNTGGTAAHTNMQPYSPIYFLIATQGYYPQRP